MEHRANMIVAYGKDRVIARDGNIPWKLASDMAHFRKSTQGNIVVYGRKTYDSLPERFRPLPERENIVLSKNKNLQFPGCIRVASINDALNVIGNKVYYVIGGAEIYKAFLPYVSRILVTSVDAEITEGKLIYFPGIGNVWDKFKCQSVSVHEKDEKNDFSFEIFEFTRKPPRP